MQNAMCDIPFKTSFLQYIGNASSLLSTENAVLPNGAPSLHESLLRVVGLLLRFRWFFSADAVLLKASHQWQILNTCICIYAPRTYEHKYSHMGSSIYYTYSERPCRVDMRTKCFALALHSKCASFHSTHIDSKYLYIVILRWNALPYT